MRIHVDTNSEELVEIALDLKGVADQMDADEYESLLDPVEAVVGLMESLEEWVAKHRAAVSALLG